MSETPIMRDIMVALSKAGARTFRNNVGVAKFKGDDGKPRYVRYGLCNGSSDVIGLTPIVITPDMVGKTVAVFTAVEVKRPKNKREQEDQQNFVAMVRGRGGIAGFARSVEQALDLIRNFRW